MEVFFSSFIKLIIIFFGSGFLTLFAVWIAKEVSVLVKDFMILKSEELVNERLTIIKKQKINSESDIYQISIGREKTMQVYSSNKNIKVL